jgi:hypothetical protein
MLASYWLFVLGAIFVLVTVFLPRGVLGLPARVALLALAAFISFMTALNAGGGPLSFGLYALCAALLAAAIALAVLSGRESRPSPQPAGEGGPGGNGTAAGAGVASQASARAGGRVAQPAE